MFVRATLILLLFIIINTATAAEGGVSFWREDFTMTCPFPGGPWDKSNEIDESHDEQTFTLNFNLTNKGLHYCGTGSDKYYFYVDGKVCKDCFELDAKLFGGIIVADMALTGLVMWIVFRCTSKRTPAGPRTPRGPARSGGPTPPTRAGEYETLSAHTLSQDPYSAINRTS